MSLVRKARAAKGLTREELAVKADISYAYVARLESDDPPTPGLDIARRLAAALGSTVDRLFPAGPIEASK